MLRGIKNFLKMAIIGKIQSNSVLLTIVIGGALLLFILSDYYKGGGGEAEFIPTATVYGDEIDEDEYEELREVFVNRELSNALNQNQGQPLSEQQRIQTEQQAEDQAFNEVIRRNLMNREFDKLGITCTTLELNDMLHGEHIHPWVEQVPIFRGVDGLFSRDSVRSFINNLDPANEPDEDESRAQWSDARKQWKDFERELKDTRRADKYVTLIQKGIFVNSIEAKHQYNANNEVRSVRFVVQRFSDIPFDEIEVTDEDIKAFYDEHKNEAEYEMQESADVDFVSFPISTSEEDKVEIINEMNKLKEQFATTTDNVAFISKHSSIDMGSDSVEFSKGELAFAMPSFMGAAQYPGIADDDIQQSKVGDIVGPYSTTFSTDGKPMAFMGKVTSVRTENQAWVRHILIKIDATRTEEEAKAISDSLIAEIKTKGNFVEMVQTMSEDDGSIANNGEYKWFPEGRMVPEFNDAAFKGAIGQLQLVKTTYGFHIVEVLGRAERIVPKMAVITKSIAPSENTLKYMEERVFDFIFTVNENSASDSAFYTLAKDSGQTVMNARIWINQSYVTGIQKPKKIMKFAFGKNALEGDLSDPILDGENYVVAFLANKIPEGAPEFEDVKEQMRFPALKDKQAKIYMEKMGGKKSLEQVALVVKNGQILNAQITFGANVIAGGGGNEPEVIGKLFTKIPVGAMTKPIKGRTGVYVCILDNISPAPETSDYSVERDYVKAARRGSADNLVIRALREAADVIDNRRKREYQ